jgi:hypothetical protein
MLLAAMVLFSSSQNDEPGSCGDGVSRKSSGPPSCYAGEPPLLATCGSGGCHDDSPVNSGTAQLNLDLGGADVNYIPGQQYTITVSLSRTGLVRGGFQIIALQDNDISTSPGIITLSDPSRTQRIDAAHPHPGPCATQNKVWIEHATAGTDNVVNNSIQWQYNWLAPSSSVGSITFYVAAIDADKDLDNTNDFVHTRTQTISTTAVGIQSITKPIVNIFPNPADKFIQVTTEQPLTICIANSLGQIIRKHHLPSAASIDVSYLEAGIYILLDENNSLLGRFVKN